MHKRLSNTILDRIEKRLERLYPNQMAGLMERLLYTVGRYGVGLDQRKPDSLWDENDVVLITYGDSLRPGGEGGGAHPLATLRRFCRKHLKGAISTVHLLPFYPWSSDDGFSVIDYREVDPDVGDWQDVEDFSHHFDLMFDLVLNHCSSRSSWFRDFVAGIQPGRHYFLEMDPETDLSAVVRPRTSPLLTRTATRDGEVHVWTTFSADQVDLNWQNPDLLFEFIDIFFLYVSRGARILRLDAVAFLWKEIGTQCIHLPQTHEMVKLFRDLCELVAPHVVILTETNVPHEENISYYGEGDEAHMVYNFSLPPLLLHGLLRNDPSYLKAWAAGLPELEAGMTWFNFSSSHDGIGVRPLAGLLPEAELNHVVEAVRERGGRVNMRTGPTGKPEPDELNITYKDALRYLDDEERSLARFLCSQAVVLSMRGVPAVYIHALLGTPNDQDGVERTGQNRSINRKKWDEPELQAELDDLDSAMGKTFRAYQRLLKRRRDHKAFHPDAEMRMLDLGEALFAFSRISIDREETIVCIFNFSGKAQVVKNPRKDEFSKRIKSFYDLISGKTLGSGAKGIKLSPYQALWLIPKVTDATA